MLLHPYQLIKLKKNSQNILIPKQYLYEKNYTINFLPVHFIFGPAG